MSMQDTLADMLTRIRNAQSARKTEVSVIASKVNAAVCEVLREEGYIDGFGEEKDGARRMLRIRLKWHEGEPVIVELQRVSRPGLRHYVGCANLPLVKNGLGVAIVSTSGGIMSDRRARVEGHGGEVLCTVF